MPKIVLALAVALAMTLAPVSSAGIARPADGPQSALAKKKNCSKKKGKAKKRCKKANRRAATPGRYKGKATSADGSFSYGDVIVERSGNQVTRVVIEAVSASCNYGSVLRTLVFNPAPSAGMKVLSGSGAIAGGRMSVRFLPVSDVEDDVIELSIVFSGKTAKGSFTESGLCSDSGIFTAAG